MKKLIFSLALMLIALSAAAQERAEYIDSLTGVKLFYSAEYDIQLMDGFQRAVISTPKTDINIYSKVNEDKKQFTWEEVNKFDSNNAYGELLRYERAPGGLDGWVRYYSNKTSKGRPYTACVILIRGNNYAFYMTEAAYNEEDLSIASLLQTAEFPKAKNESKTAKKRGWIILAILMAAPLVLFYPLKKLEEKVLVILGIISTVAATLTYLFLIDMSIYVLYVTIIAFIPWLAVISSDSLKGALCAITKVLGDA